MSEPSLEDIEREEIEMLLPWYATGKLDRDDLAKVEAYLAAHAEVARQLDLVRTEREQTVALNEGLGGPSAGATERIMAALSATTPVRAAWRSARDSARDSIRGVVDRIGAPFAAPAASGLRWAAVAVAALVAVETVTVATLLMQRSGTYQTASRLDGGGGIVVLVAFADEAKASAISQLLADFDARIVDGPKAGGLYKVRLQTEDTSQAAREALVRRLAERRDVVSAVLPGKD